MTEPMIHKVHYRFGNQEIELSLEQLEPPVWWDKEIRRFFSFVNQLQRPAKVQYVRREIVTVTADPVLVQAMVNSIIHEERLRAYGRGYNAGRKKVEQVP